MISARVIKDSISPDGVRLSTVEITMHRFVLSEFNTHRQAEKNSASSRAIPIIKQLKKILSNPAYPVEFGTAKAGMQADAPLTGIKEKLAKLVWKTSSVLAAGGTYALMKLDVHKQVANRIIEPFMWHTVIATATYEDWEHIFGLRISELAQPEIHAAIAAVKVALGDSTPQPLRIGEWHLPFVSEAEKTSGKFSIEKLKEMSVARCARVSYLTHDGLYDPEKDIALFLRLVGARPIHASPLGHVATPVPEWMATPGPFRSWRQFRHEQELRMGVMS